MVCVLLAGAFWLDCVCALLSGRLLIVLVSCFYMCLFVVFICQLLCDVSCFSVDVVGFVMVLRLGVCGLCLFVLFVGLLCLFVSVGFVGWQWFVYMGLLLGIRVWVLGVDCLVCCGMDG